MDGKERPANNIKERIAAGAWRANLFMMFLSEALFELVDFFELVSFFWLDFWFDGWAMRDRFSGRLGCRFGDRFTYWWFDVDRLGDWFEFFLRQNDSSY